MAGSMYPILIRLADRELLETIWESEVPTGRPPRHLYRLTGHGLELAADLAAAPAHTGKTSGPGCDLGRRERDAIRLNFTQKTYRVQRRKAWKEFHILLCAVAPFASLPDFLPRS